MLFCQLCLENPKEDNAALPLLNPTTRLAAALCFCFMWKSLIRMLHPLQSCLNPSQCRLILCPGEVIWSSSLYRGLSCCCLSDQGFIFSFGFYSHRSGQFTAFLRLHHPVSSRMWGGRKWSYFMPWRSFISQFSFFHLQSSSSSQLVGGITLSFWRGGRELHPEQQRLSPPQPADYSESAGFLCLPSLVSHLFDQILFLPRMRLIMLSSGFDLLQRYPECSLVFLIYLLQCERGIYI